MTSVIAMLVVLQSLNEQSTTLLIAQLGNEEYAVREAATAALVRLVQSDEGHLLVPRLEAATITAMWSWPAERKEFWPSFTILDPRHTLFCPGSTCSRPR